MFNLFKAKENFDLGDLLISLIIHVGGGGLIGIITSNSKVLYESLEKPFFAPPAYVFPIIWTILYIMMAISVYRIYEIKKRENVKGALGFYLIHLILNFFWSIIFFKLKLYGIAFIELFVLIIFLLITMWKFMKVDKISAYLLLPYSFWCIFALVLNFYIWMLNEM